MSEYISSDEYEKILVAENPGALEAIESNVAAIGRQASTYVPIEQFKRTEAFALGDEDTKFKMLAEQEKAALAMARIKGIPPSQVAAQYDREKRLAIGADTGWFGDKMRRTAESAINTGIEGVEGVVRAVGGGDNAAADKLKGWADDVRGYFAENPNMDGDWWSDAASGLGNLIGFGATYQAGGLIGRIASVNKKVAAGAAALAGSMGLEYKQSFDQVLEATGDIEKAHEAGLMTAPAGVIDFLSDKFIMDRILKPLKAGQVHKTGDLAKAIVLSPLIEGGTEMVQGAWEDAASRAASGDSRFNPLDWNKRIREGTVGAALGGLGSIRPAHQYFTHPDRKIQSEADGITQDAEEKIAANAPEVDPKIEAEIGKLSDEIDLIEGRVNDPSGSKATPEDLVRLAELEKQRDALYDSLLGSDEAIVSDKEEEASIAWGVKADKGGKREAVLNVTGKPAGAKVTKALSELEKDNNLTDEEKAVVKGQLESLLPPATDKPAETIVGTAIRIGGKDYRGDNPMDSHADIFNKHKDEMLLGDIPDLNRDGGFIVKGADGVERFVTRGEALGIGKASGQIAESEGTAHSQIIKEPGTFTPKPPVAAPPSALPPKVAPTPASAGKTSRRASLEEEMANLMKQRGENPAGFAEDPNASRRMQEIVAEMSVEDDTGQTALSTLPFRTQVAPRTIIVSDRLQTAKREEVSETLAQVDDEQQRNAIASGLEEFMPMLAAYDIKVEINSGRSKDATGATFSGQKFGFGMNEAGMFILIPKTVNKSPVESRKLAEHEGIHAGVAASMMQEWAKGGKKESFREFYSGRMSDLGLSVAGASTDSALEGFFGAYFKPEGLKNLKAGLASMRQNKNSLKMIGEEFLRAALERARTGKLSEDVEALAASSKGGKLLKKLFEILKQWRAGILRLINPKTAPPSFKRTFDAVNEFLDNYGVLAPPGQGENIQKGVISKQTDGFVATPKVKAKVEPKKTKGTSIEDIIKDGAKIIKRVINGVTRRVMYMGQRGTNQSGRFWSTSLSFAETYGPVVGATLAVKNPMIYHDAEEWRDAFGGSGPYDGIADALVKGGYDSAVLETTRPDGSKLYSVFVADTSVINKIKGKIKVGKKVTPKAEEPQPKKTPKELGKELLQEIQDQGGNRKHPKVIAKLNELIDAWTEGASAISTADPQFADSVKEEYLKNTENAFQSFKDHIAHAMGLVGDGHFEEGHEWDDDLADGFIEFVKAISDKLELNIEAIPNPINDGKGPFVREVKGKAKPAPKASAPNPAQAGGTIVSDNKKAIGRELELVKSSVVESIIAGKEDADLFQQFVGLVGLEMQHASDAIVTLENLEEAVADALGVPELQKWQQDVIRDDDTSEPGAEISGAANDFLDDALESKQAGISLTAKNSDALKKAQTMLAADALGVMPDYQTFAEIMQNAIDAARKQAKKTGERGKVTAEVYVKTGTHATDDVVITVTDNGTGMSEEIFKGPFITLGETTKGADDSGQFGRAKLGYMTYPLTIAGYTDDGANRIVFGGTNVQWGESKANYQVVPSQGRGTVMRLRMGGEFLKYPGFRWKGKDSSAQMTYLVGNFVTSFISDTVDVEARVWRFNHDTTNLDDLPPKADPDEVYSSRKTIEEAIRYTMDGMVFVQKDLGKGNVVRMFLVANDTTMEPGFVVANKGIPLQITSGGFAHSFKDVKFEKGKSFDIYVDFIKTGDPKKGAYPFVRNRFGLDDEYQDQIDKMVSEYGMSLSQAHSKESKSALKKAILGMPTLRSGNNSVRLVTRPASDDATQKLMDEFIADYGQALAELEPLFAEYADEWNKYFGFRPQIAITFDPMFGFRVTDSFSDKELIRNEADFYAVNPVMKPELPVNLTPEMREKFDDLNSRGILLGANLEISICHELNHKWKQADDSYFIYNYNNAELVVPRQFRTRMAQRFQLLLASRIGDLSAMAARSEKLYRDGAFHIKLVAEQVAGGSSKYGHGFLGDINTKKQSGQSAAIAPRGSGIGEDSEGAGSGGSSDSWIQRAVAGAESAGGTGVLRGDLRDQSASGGNPEVSGKQGGRGSDEIIVTDTDIAGSAEPLEASSLPEGLWFGEASEDDSSQAADELKRKSERDIVKARVSNGRSDMSFIDVNAGNVAEENRILPLIGSDPENGSEIVVPLDLRNINSVWYRNLSDASQKTVGLRFVDKSGRQLRGAVRAGDFRKMLRANEVDEVRKTRLEMEGYGFKRLDIKQGALEYEGKLKFVHGEGGEQFEHDFAENPSDYDSFWYAGASEQSKELVSLFAISKDGDLHEFLMRQEQFDRYISDGSVSVLERVPVAANNEPEYWSIRNAGSSMIALSSRGRKLSEPFTGEGFDRLMGVIGKSKYELIGFPKSQNETIVTDTDIAGSANDIRFDELTKELPEVMTARDIANWREANPGKWDELKAMRVRILIASGYDTGPVYHGTQDDFFPAFDRDKITRAGFGFGFHFSAGSSLAKIYARQWAGYKGSERGRVMEAYLNIRNPANYDEYRAAGGLAGLGLGHELDTVIELKKRGFDGIKYDHGKWDGVTQDDAVTYVAFRPNQIKTADPLSPGQKKRPSEWGDTGSNEIAGSAESISDKDLEDLDSADESIREASHLQFPEDALFEPGAIKRHAHFNRHVEVEGVEAKYQQQSNPQTHTAAAKWIEDNGGTYKAARAVLTNGILDAARETPDDASPLSFAHAVMGQLLNRLSALGDKIRYGRRSAGKFRQNAAITETHRALYNLRLEYNLGMGQAIQSEHMMDEFVDGGKVVQDYMAGMMGDLGEKMGGNRARKRGQQIVSAVRELAGELRDKVAKKVLSRGEAILLMKRLQRRINSPKFKKNAYRTYARGRDLVAWLKHVLAGSAESFSDSESEFYADAAMRSILNEIDWGNANKQATPRSREDMVVRALSETIRARLKEAGLIKDKKFKSDPLAKLSLVVNSEEMYSDFVTRLIDAMAQSATDNGVVADLRGIEESLRSRAWDAGLVQRAVKSMSSRLSINAAKLVRQHYGRTEDARQAIVDGIMEAMPDLNDSQAERLANDIEEAFDDRVKDVRTRFYGGERGVRSGLKSIGKSLKQLAGEYDRNLHNIDQTFLEYLKDTIGLPDTAEMPMATEIAELWSKALREQLPKERQKIIDRLKERGLPATVRNVTDIADRILKHIHTGTLTDPETYNILAEKFGLPAYSPEVAERLKEYGDKIALAPKDSSEQREHKVRMINYIKAEKGVSMSEMVYALYYSHMLSGLSTQIVNAIGNAFSFLAEVGVALARNIANPHRTAQILRAVYLGFTRGGWQKAKSTFLTGVTIGKLEDKLQIMNPLEAFDPSLDLERDSSLGYKAVGKYANLMKWVGRAMMSVDVAFYKMSQNVVAASKGVHMGTQDQWDAAKTAARNELIGRGMTEDEKDFARLQEVRAVELYEEARIGGDDDKFIAWVDAHEIALETTFNNEVKGPLGKIATGIANTSKHVGLLKLVVPFTRVVANVTNRSLDFTPWGFIRAIRGIKGDSDWNVRGVGTAMEAVKSERFIRAAAGTVGLVALFAKAAQHADEDDPEFAIFGRGPADQDARELFYERGGKPYTVKIGDAYYSYLTSPMSVALGAIGAIFDGKRDEGRKGLKAGEVTGDLLSGHTILSMLNVTFSQSFLSGLSDLISAIDSPHGERKFQAFLGRTAGTMMTPFGNLTKQIDKYWLNPEIQQSEGLRQAILKEIPFARNSLNVRLNRFGEPITNKGGLLGSRFVTFEQTEDPVIRFLAHNNITPPGFGGNWKIGDRLITPEERRKVVEIAGPRIKEMIAESMPELSQMNTRAEKEEFIKAEATALKLEVIDAIRSGEIVVKSEE